MNASRIHRPGEDGGGEEGEEGEVRLLAEKQWNNAKFSIRELRKVTPACR